MKQLLNLLPFGKNKFGYKSLASCFIVDTLRRRS
jgi:hypothetical protein